MDWDGTGVHHSVLCHLLHNRSSRAFLQKVPLSGPDVTRENTEHPLSLLERNEPTQSTPGWRPVSLSFKSTLMATLSSEVLICISSVCCQNGDIAWILVVLLNTAGPDSVNGKKCLFWCWPVSWTGIWRGHRKGDVAGKCKLPDRNNSEIVGFPSARGC